jgi:hypothetical protein
MKLTAGLGTAILAAVILAGCATPDAAEPARTLTIRTEGHRKWLEGVKGWFCGGKESSVHAAHESIMQAMGEDLDYTWFIGVSGLAFRMQVSGEGLCPSSPHSYVGYRCYDISDKALPYSFTRFELRESDDAKIAEARQAVMACIDRGIPAQYGSEEDGVIIGYGSGGQELICLHYMYDGGKTPFANTQAPWGIQVFGEHRTNMPPKREMIVESLRRAVDMAHTQETNGYYVGFKAWDKFISRVEALDDADEKTRFEAMTGNSWIYECLTNYREQAALYLRRIAGEFDEDTALHLTRAADLYDRISAGTLKKDKCTISIAPLPWSLAQDTAWTGEMRADQVRRLKEALPLEHEAISEIEEALALMEKD